MSNTIRIDFDISCVDTLKEKLAARRNRAQEMLDLAVIKDTDPFVPMRQGTLASSALRSTKVGSGEVVYDTPYARHMYYGVHYRTGKPFKYSTLKHPLACKEWVGASKAVNIEKWKKEVKEVLANG